MPRKYETKGDERLAHNLSVPLSAALIEALRERAAQAGVSAAEFVRRLIAGAVMERK